MQYSKTNRQLRNARRSAAHREYTGYIHTILCRVDSWKMFEENPLQWLLEFREHQHFNLVLKDFFTERHGSRYTSEITEDFMENFLRSIDIKTFLLRLASINSSEDSTQPENSGGKPAQHSQTPAVNTSNADSYPEVNAENKEHELESSIIIQMEKQFNVKLSPLTLPATDSWADTVDEENSMSVISTIFGNDYYATGRYNTSETQKRIKDNDVYYLSQRLYGRGNVKIPLVIYAPPNSGKTILRKYLFGNQIRDTDQMFYWAHNSYSPVVITNMHHLIERAKVSIAITPSRDVFRARLYNRNIKAPSSWYSDMIKSSAKATLHIRSNDYLRQVFESRFADIRSVCPNIITLLNEAVKPSVQLKMFTHMKLEAVENY